MERLAGRAIFSVRERVFIWEDVVLAAHLSGDVAALEERAARGVAAERRLAASGDAVRDDDVDEAATQWRYDRDLIAADDLESWLDTRELGVDEWLAYFRRGEALERVRGAVRSGGASGSAKKTATPGLDAIVYADAMCSGTIARVTERLAGHVAVGDVATTERRARKAVTTKVRAAVGRLPSAVKKQGLYGLDAATTIRRAESIVEMAAAAERFANALGARDAVKREIEAHELEWTQLRCKTLLFDDEEAAREAALLIREDGLTIAKAAAVANTLVHNRDVVLEDTDGPLRDRLLGAQAGDLLGPIPTDEGFVVVAVEKRVAPSHDEPAVRRRATDRIVQRVVRAEVDERITWHERF